MMLVILIMEDRLSSQHRVFHKQYARIITWCVKNEKETRQTLRWTRVVHTIKFYFTVYKCSIWPPLYRQHGWHRANMRFHAMWSAAVIRSFMSSIFAGSGWTDKQPIKLRQLLFQIIIVSVRYNVTDPNTRVIFFETPFITQQRERTDSQDAFDVVCMIWEYMCVQRKSRVFCLVPVCVNPSIVHWKYICQAGSKF